MPSRSGGVTAVSSVSVTDLNTPVRRSRAAARSNASGSKTEPSGRPAIARIRRTRIRSCPFITSCPNRSFGPGSNTISADSFAAAWSADKSCDAVFAKAWPRLRHPSTPAPTASKITPLSAVFPTANPLGNSVRFAKGANLACEKENLGPGSTLTVMREIRAGASNGAILAASAPST